MLYRRLPLNIALTCACTFAIAGQTMAEDKESPDVAALAAKDQQTHHFADLGLFFMPAIQFEQGTVGKAVEQLIKEYQSICKATGQTPLEIKVQVDEAATLPTSFVLEGSFDYMLSQLSSLGGLDYNYKDGLLSFTHLEAGDKLITKKYIFPPDFPSRFITLKNQDENEVAEAEQSIKRLFPSLKEIKFSKARTELTVTGDAATVQQVESFTQNIRKHRTAQMKFLTRVVSHDKAVAKESAMLRELLPKLGESTILDDGPAQILHRELVLPVGAGESAPYPSAIMRNKEHSDIQIHKEVGDSWVGSKLSFTDVLAYGFNVNESVRFEYRFAGEPNITDILAFHKIQPKEEDIQTWLLEFKCSVPDGHTVIYKVKELEKEDIYLMISSHLIDPTGQAVRR